MNDFFSNNYSESLDSQLSCLESKAGDDFNLSCLGDQSQDRSQGFDFMKGALGLYNDKYEHGLKVIEEENQYGEEENRKGQRNYGAGNQKEESNNKFKKAGEEKSSSNNVNSNLQEKIARLSQEIDEIYESSQKEQTSNNVNTAQNVSNLNSHNNVNSNLNVNRLSVNNNFNTENSPFHQENQKMNQSLNPPMKNFQIKTVAVPNTNSNFQQPQYVNPKAQMINNYTNQHMINQMNRSKNKTGNYSDMNMGYEPLNSSFSANLGGLGTPINHHLSSSMGNHFSDLSSSFLHQSDEMIGKTLNLLDTIKGNFCMLIDNYKAKYSRDAELIKQILVAETEHVLVEEEKNKIIDHRMETLFREMMNLLNDFQKF